MASKARKICSSSSGHSHCPDRGSEMIFKSSKRCSFLQRDLSSFSEELQAQKPIVYQSLLSMSSPCLGLCATQVEAGEVWPCSFLLPRQLIAPLLPLAFFFNSGTEFELQNITRGILCIHFLFRRQFSPVPSLPLSSAHMADLPGRCQELSWVAMSHHGRGAGTR